MKYTSYRLEFPLLLAVLLTSAAVLVVLSQTFVARAQSAAPTCTLVAIPTSVAPGNYSTLSWSSTNADGLSFNQGIGTTTSAASGSLSVQPTTTPITYTATFSGSGGTTTCSATVATPGSGADSALQQSPQTTASSTPSPVVTTIGPMPTVATIDENGQALIRGTVTSASASSLSIATWGGTWTIPLPVSAVDITPLGTNSMADFSGISYGDFVGVSGTVSQAQPWTILPSVVRDWTKAPPETISTETPLPTTPTNDSGTTASSTESTASSTAGIPPGDTLFTGTISGIGANSFTLTDESGTPYSVSLTSDATLWNSARNVIPFSVFVEGDNIRLDGQMQSDGTIIADVLRDTAR